MFKVTELQQRWGKESGCLSVLEQECRGRLDTCRQFSFSSVGGSATDPGWAASSLVSLGSFPISAKVTWMETLKAVFELPIVKPWHSWGSNDPWHKKDLKYCLPICHHKIFQRGRGKSIVIFSFSVESGKQNTAKQPLPSGQATDIDPGHSIQKVQNKQRKMEAWKKEAK